MFSATAFLDTTGRGADAQSSAIRGAALAGGQGESAPNNSGKHANRHDRRSKCRARSATSICRSLRSTRAAEAVALAEWSGRKTFVCDVTGEEIDATDSGADTLGISTLHSPATVPRGLRSGFYCRASVGEGLERLGRSA